jgi:hypothetical protein
VESAAAPVPAPVNAVPVGRQKDRQTERQAYRHTGIHAYRHIGIPRDRETERQAGREAGTGQRVIPAPPSSLHLLLWEHRHAGPVARILVRPGRHLLTCPPLNCTAMKTVFF